MIEDMMAVMRRIHEIQARFGLVRRHNPPVPAPQVQPSDTLSQIGNGVNPPLSGGESGDGVSGVNDVEHAINYIIGHQPGSGAAGPNSLPHLGSGLTGLVTGGGGLGQSFLQTLADSIRSEEGSENE